MSKKNLFIESKKNLIGKNLIEKNLIGKNLIGKIKK